jgi:hypothetical protein
MRILFFEKCDEHSELCAPIADVVLADDGVAFEFVEAGDAVADDGAAEMADVHLFGDIGAGVIDDDGLGRLGLFDAQPLLCRCLSPADG